MTRRLLLRSLKSPFRPAGAGTTLLHNLIGGNVGNLVFLQASYRLLSTHDTRIDTSKLIGLDPRRVNDTYDQVVIPLANAFRSSFAPTLDALTELIRRLRIPVVVLGVGAQSRLNGRVPASPVDASVKAFVGAVLDHSASIGVRGEFTRAYLNRLGFGDDVVDVIGCPSMFMHGPSLRIRPKIAGGLSADSPIALNISPYVPAMGPVSVDQAARYPNLMYLAQDHLTLGLMVTGRYHSAEPAPPQSPTTLDHPLLAANRTRFCLDPATWFDYLRQFDFSFGTRIHGNIAALLAGTPALVLAHDGRTLELARYHEIPRVKVPTKKVIDARAFYGWASWARTVSGQAERWERMAAFLARNGLRHIYAPGESGEDFDARLAACRFPSPVEVGDFTPLRPLVRARFGLENRAKQSAASGDR